MMLPGWLGLPREVPLPPWESVKEISAFSAQCGSEYGSGIHLVEFNN
jgi:hypothetical protein